MIRGDEALRQAARAMRKARKGPAMRETIQAKIEEHQASIAQAKQMAQQFQEQLQGIMTDIVRREGAVMSLRELLGTLPAPIAPVPDQPPSGAV